MTFALPLCTVDDFVPYKERYRLLGKHFLALPGCIADTPEEGADKYNQNLLKHIIVSNKYENINLAHKYPRNRRVLKIQKMLVAGNGQIGELSSIEGIILLSMLADNLD